MAVVVGAPGGKSNKDGYTQKPGELLTVLLRTKLFPSKNIDFFKLADLSTPC